ncbi:MAG: 3-isopropylmalate dehydratase large subunit [Gemmatimonadetes bacterium]|nr:3-isopropylmalate dehydratase large subunit [Gemmatimonadota bacterium]
MSGKTVSEKILSTTAGVDARAGDLVVCRFDRALGTDGSVPMAIDYLRRMGATRVVNPERILFSLDHYSPPSSLATARFHDVMRAFAREHGIDLRFVGEGISHQMAVELGYALPGGLVVGADSHTVTCGAVNAFATGIGSSDLAAAMICGRVWLKVPESVRVMLTGALRAGACAKDIALTLLEIFGNDGANYLALEFQGPGLATLSMDDRLVLSSMSVEMGAKAGIFPFDGVTERYLEGRAAAAYSPAHADPDARYVRDIAVDLGDVSPRISLPHSPDNVVPLERVLGTPIHMVFVGTCTGGRTTDVRQVTRVLEAGGGIAPGVQLVVTPASRLVFEELVREGILSKLVAAGATITTPGCGACCGTSGSVPGDGMNVISTANRNFKGRMGNLSAAIYLASPVVCAAAAVTGRITDPRDVPT